MDNLKIILVMAWRNLWRNKTRTAIMIAATLFAVFFAISMRSVQEGVYDRHIANMANYYTGYIQIQHKDFEEEKSLDFALTLTDELEQQLSKQEDITGFTPRLENFILASSNDITKGILITGTDPDKENAMTGLAKKVIAGNYFKKDHDGILIGKDLAKYMKIVPGDTLVLIGSGYHAHSAVGKYQVDGILEFGSPQLNSNVVYMPLLACQNLFSAPNMATSIAINLDNRSEIPMVQSDLRQQIQNDELVVKNWEEMMPELVNSIEADRSSGGIMLGVLYLIIGFVIYGTLIMMLSERKREFSTLMAIGMKNKLLAFTLLAECVIMTLIGALLGGLISIPLTSWLHRSPIPIGGNASKAYEQVGFEPVITAITDPSIISAQAITVAIMSLLLSIYPMIKLWRSNALDGLRS